ncbi:MAG: acetyl-CoA carboxylase biotin carboxylase subunit [Deltaproteobacteria bacterium]|nr:acetyl-CoA carboxylase biotin carboxylase subunit [Deltaproteobacteria bacterium]
MFKRILVANRGEIAIRIMRACRELGIQSVAVYSDVDREALFANYADEAYYLGPSPAAESYLHIPRILAVAQKAQVEAIHPGYGFLAENPNFAKACERAGIRFIGPSSRTLELSGNKIMARQIMARAGLPVVPGTRGKIKDPAQAARFGRSVGYPVILKPAYGGGGIGMRVIEREEELVSALESAQTMARQAFGGDEIFIEKYLPRPRHIEFQILGDERGNIIHLGERECTIQRRHQKILEEAPSPVMDRPLRQEMGRVAVAAAKAINYTNAGTIEFIFSGGKFYFLEVNARIQVEHAITEMVTGVDLVKEQIKIAAGQSLDIYPEDVALNGWAIECRINAEDPLNGFAPCPGKLSGYRSPGGTGIRVDSGVHTRYTIPSYYDPMISKLIIWGRDRQETIQRARRALYEYIIVGVCTNIPFLKAVVQNPSFVKGEMTTHFIEEERELFQDMVRIMEEEKSLEEKLTTIFNPRRKAAAIAMALEAYRSQVE